MSFSPPSPSKESVPIKEDGEDLEALLQPKHNQDRREFSESEGPVVVRRQVRETIEDQHEGIAVRGRCVVLENSHDSSDYTRDQSSPRQHSKSSPKIAGKRKRPGPRAWAAKPIMKNDMKAKVEVIRGIESLWGRGFIKSYIPVCHRPLIKRGKDNKRPSYRRHETDPKKWLPSVLKAILMIAKLTDDKTWLKDAMNDVVRYRIKHTGNRKPQLVTTDFDVVEDMLIKDWKVPYAFSIRYKHLLVNRKDQLESDENINHILQAHSDQDDSDLSVNNNEDDDATDREEKHDEDSEEDEELHPHDDISANYLQSNKYVTAPPYPSPGPSRQRSKQQNLREEMPVRQTRTNLLPQQQYQRSAYSRNMQMPGYSGHRTDPWGRPSPVYGDQEAYGHAHSGYTGHGGGYGGYCPPLPRRDVGHRSRQPPTPGMAQHPTLTTPAFNSEYEDKPKKQGHFLPFGANKSTHEMLESSAAFEIQHYPNYCHHSGRTKSKRESSTIDEHPQAANGFDAPDNNTGSQNSDMDDKDLIDAEVETTRLELKLAKLKARQLKLKQQRKK
jgi:hypothetical protein